MLAIQSFARGRTSVVAIGAASAIIGGTVLILVSVGVGSSAAQDISTSETASTEGDQNEDEHELDGYVYDAFSDLEVAVWLEGDDGQSVARLRLSLS